MGAKATRLKKVRREKTMGTPMPAMRENNEYSYARLNIAQVLSNISKFQKKDMFQGAK